MTASGDCQGSTLEFCGQNTDGGPGLTVVDCTSAFAAGEAGTCEVIDQNVGANCVAPLGGACVFLDANDQPFQVFCGGTGAGCVESDTGFTCQPSVGNCVPFIDGGALFANPPSGAPCLSSGAFLQCLDNQALVVDCTSFGSGTCDSVQSDATFGECLLPANQPCGGILACESGTSCPAAPTDGGFPVCVSSGGSTGSTGTTGSTGSSGSTGGTTGTSLTGTDAFTVGKAIDVFSGFSDGGTDPTVIEIDLTNDATDTCDIQETGFPDGGLPAKLKDELRVIILDPNGVTTGTAYTSLTASQWDNFFADGGGAPTGGFSQMILQTGFSDTSGGTTFLGVSGTATVSNDATTMLVDDTFSTTVQKVTFNASTGAPTGLTGTPSALSGSGTPANMCAIEFLEQ